ncbi:transposon Tf2-9 polyprotein [Trichonephila clavipes]|nr:transposon Tf2-9 polyprotein [Trichonephila clavipes]
MGAVLTQLTEQGEEHPILYLSKKFSEVEKRYCTTEKECASIVFAIKRLHYYLDGNSFLVMTDHNPLVWLNRNVSSNPRLMRWALALQPYNFRIVHRSERRLRRLVERFRTDSSHVLKVEGADFLGIKCPGSRFNVNLIIYTYILRATYDSSVQETRLIRSFAFPGTAFPFRRSSVGNVEEGSVVSHCSPTGELLATDFEIFNHGQVTRMRLELAPISPNYHTTPMLEARYFKKGSEF